MSTTGQGLSFFLKVALAVTAVISICCATGTPSWAATTNTSSAELARSAPLVGPKTTSAEDTTYISDVTKADSKLAAYAQRQGNVALKALLTDGAGFCAFLRRDSSLDKAILDTAIGAKSLETQTHLPYTITTFNTVEAVALLTLCPSEQSLVPASVRAKLHRLGSSLRLGSVDG